MGRSKGKEPQSGVVGWVLALSVALLIIAIMIANSDGLTPEWFLSVMCLSMGTALFAIALLIEQTILRPLLNYASAAIFWIVLIGVATFFARRNALSDINNIFAFDASALPMTLSAGIAFHLAYFLFWPLVIGSCVSAIYCIGAMRGSEPEGAIGAFVICVMTCISAFCVHQWFSDAARREQILYRVAHMTDFSSKFNCAGVDPEKFQVLFVGPEQRRISVAPIIPETILFFGKRPPRLLQNVTLPDKRSLELRDCLPISTVSPDPVADRIDEIHFEIKPSR